MEGLVLLQEAVGQERRPLSWWLGPQGIERPPKPSLRDRKRTERQGVTTLRSPEEAFRRGDERGKLHDEDVKARGTRECHFSHYERLGFHIEN